MKSNFTPLLNIKKAEAGLIRRFQSWDIWCPWNPWGPKAPRQKECDAREVDCLDIKWAPDALPQGGLRVKSSDLSSLFSLSGHGINDVPVVVPKRLARFVCEKVGP